ncbi:MAG: hypothetical protein WD737_00225 [Gemmatimonadota bacterium]
MSEELPFRIGPDGRSATWNPALTRAAQVLVHVEGADGGVEIRRSMNSGRARVREGERIVRIHVQEA